MARAPFDIGGQSIAPGTRETLRLPVSVLSDHTPVGMALHVVHGRRDGPVVFVSAGIHGDEVIGVEIVRRLLRTDLKTLRGTLICVPVVNAFGFHGHSRYMPDRRDLNRSFPGSEDGSLAARVAHMFLDQIVSRADLGVDLHTAAIHRNNLPQIRISDDDGQMLKLAQTFGAPVVLRAPLREGTLRSEARKRGVDMLLYEAGEALRFDETAVRTGVMGILRVLHELKMLPKRAVAKARSNSVVCRSSRWIRAPQGGLFRGFAPAGAAVQKGDLLASVSDPFGETDIDVEATIDGVIIGHAVMPVVNEGDALYHIARYDDPGHAESTFSELTAQVEDEPLFDEDEII